MKTPFLFFLIIILYIISIGCYIFYIKSKKSDKKQYKSSAAKCDEHSCGALDPVSDPRYNMQQIVKQSILLEEHLANKNKRCRDCITKHFLHIIGLAEEAQMLATNKIAHYPMVNESVELYNRLFEKWQKGVIKGDEDNVLCCCDELRTMRKKLIIIYFFDEKISKEEKKF